MKITGLNFNSHHSHNPNCDILEGHIDFDTFITFGIYIRDTTTNKKGDRFMELYIGENYKVGSLKKSYSRKWNYPNIPRKYFNLWVELSNTYVTNYL